MIARHFLVFFAFISWSSYGIGQTLTVDLPSNATPAETSFAKEFSVQLNERGFDTKLSLFEHDIGTYPERAAQADLTVMFLARFGKEIQSDGASLAVLSYPLLTTSPTERIIALRSEIAARAAARLGRREAFPIGFFGSIDSALLTLPQTSTVDQIEGLKLGINDPLARQFMSDLGADVTQSAFGEIYPAMKTGSIDGIETSIEALPNYLELGGTMSATVWPEFRSNTGVVLTSSATWDLLSPRQHREIDAALEAALRSISARQEADVAEFLERYAGDFLQVASTDARRDIVERAKESFVAQYGEEGEMVLRELEALFEASGATEEPKRLKDRGDLNLPGARVFFVTDRRYFPDEARFVDRFGGVPRRASQLRCGGLSLDVQGAPLGEYQSEVAPEGVLKQGRKDCLELIANGGRKKLLFIHGFNNTFEDATKRALALARDLNLSFTDVIIWSWPSAGRVFGAYSKDEVTIERSALRFIKLLRAWHSRNDDLEPIIISHSMGSRIVGMSIEQMRESVDGFTFILAAADIGTDLFRKVISYTSARTVLYVSSQDLALVLSRIVNFRAPVGAHHSLEQDNTEVIDLSRRYRDHAHVFVSHGAFDDLREFVSTKAAPIERGLIQRIDRSGFIYWELPTSH